MEHNPTAKHSNKRKSTRFIRTDIKVSIVKSGFLGLNDAINCKLRDISSSGVQISTPTKLAADSKLTVILSFDAGKVFKLKARIIHHQKTETYLSVHSFPKIIELVDDEEISLHELCLYEDQEQVSAKFRNLDPHSVKILTHSPLNLRKQHSLIFILSNGKKHKVLTEIHDYHPQKHNYYGIKFVKTSDELADYSLDTQTDLIFK